MTTTTVDLQIFPPCTCSECIIEVARTLCGINGVQLSYVNHENAKFTIKTTLHPEQIRDALQQRFPGTSVAVSRRMDTPNSSTQRPVNIHGVVRELVEGSRGNGLQNVEITESTTIRANFTVHDSEDGGDGYANAAPPPTLPPPLPPRQYQPATYGYGYVAPPSQPAPPPPQQYQPSTYGSTWAYEGYGPPLPSGGHSTILLFLFYGILILFLVISIKTE